MSAVSCSDSTIQQFTLQRLLMSAAWFIVIYVATLLGALCGLGIYFEMRRRSFGPAHPEDRVFRCTKCGFVYTDDADVDRSRCSQCGKLNEPIEF